MLLAPSGEQGRVVARAQAPPGTIAGPTLSAGGLDGCSDEWLPPVYEAASWWVHLLPFHARMSWTVVVDQDEGEHRLQGRFPMRPETIPLSALKELLAP